MRPRTLEGQFWHPNDANNMVQHIVRQAKDEMTARDIKRGLPATLSCMVADGNGNLVVDPRLSRIKHSGRETSELWTVRWQEFCSVPRDPAVELAKVGLAAMPTELNPLEGIPAAISAAIEAGISKGIEAAMATSGGKGKQ